MDKNVLDPQSSDAQTRLAELEAELNGLDLIPLLERLQQRFDLSVNQLAVSADLDEAAVRKILNGEKRRLKPNHVDALLDDLETCGKLTDPAEKWIWHRALRVAAHLNAITYKEIEPILLKIGDPIKKAEALAAYVRNQYPALAQTHDDTGGLLPGVLPLVDILARRLHDHWNWIRVPEGYEAIKITDDSYSLIGKGLFPKKIHDLGPELEVKDTGFGTYTVRRRRLTLPSPIKPAQASPLTEKPAPDQAEPRAGRRTARYIEPELIRIPAGEFWMGSIEHDRNAYNSERPDAYGSEKPQHRVFLPEYWVARYPVTNEEYRRFLQDNPLQAKTAFEYAAGKDQHPVFGVSWYEALAYCRWLSEVTGKSYTLPSEAAWEKAARGADRRIYPWGNDLPDETRCNFNNNENGTTRVGKYSPRGDSPYGCADMAGNVDEWTLSKLKNYPYQTNDDRNEIDRRDDTGVLPSFVNVRVLRGGTFVGDQHRTRCAIRGGYNPYLCSWFTGFRVVASPGSRSCEAP